MKKNLTRILSLLLVLVLMVGVLPVSALADGWDLTGELDTEQLLERAESVEMQSNPAVDGYNYSIMFLDCGRKYYSVDSIKKLIDNASAAGFNYIQLAVGNDGLRLLLDDMKLTVNGTTYTSEDVSNAIHAGNEKYYNFDVDELTQSEMDTIIDYAKLKNMGVIPCVNTPGHMDAILDAATSLTGKNCSYNGSARTIDVTNATAVAFTQALLQKYITYFAGKGCKLFNMGADEYANDIYTVGGMGFGNLQSAGKYSYYVTYVNQVAKMIKGAGMTPMAFNDGIYFNSDTYSGTFDTEIIICYWSSGWSGYSPMSASALAGKGFKMVNTNGDYYWVLGKADAQCGAEKASKFNVNTFPGSTISNPVGAMFCIWADYPGAETEDSVIRKTAATIVAFGGTLPETKPGSTTPKFEIVDCEGGSTPTLEVGKALTLRIANGASAEWSASPADIVQIEVSDSANANRSAAVTGSSVKVTALKAGEVTITATNPEDAGQTADFTLTVQPRKATDITVYVGQNHTITVNGSVQVDTPPDTSIATVTTAAGTSSVPVLEQITGTADLESGKSYLIESAQAANNGNNATLLTNYTDGDKLKLSGAPSTTPPDDYPKWTITKYYDNYYYIQSGSNYLTIGDGTAGLNSSKVELTLSTMQNDGTTYWDISRTYLWKTYHLNQYGGATAPFAAGYKKDASNDAGSCWNIYKITEETVETTTITFHGVAEGNTTATIGGVDYNIHVVSKSLADVTPLEIEFWITNAKTTDSDGKTFASIAATTGTVASEAGHDAADLLPKTTKKEERDVDYWHSRLLDKTQTNGSTSGTAQQTEQNGDDETNSGVAFTKIRYFNGVWSVFTANNEWVTVESNHQLVAYYAEHIKVTDEVDSHASDWGKLGDGSPSTAYLDPRYVNTLSFQVVYEDSTTNPVDTTAANLRSKTICYGYWTDGRGIGSVILDETENFEIYKVTAQTGSMTGSSSGNYQPYTISSFSWEKNEETVWENNGEADWAGTYNNGQVVVYNNTVNPKRDGVYQNLHWSTNNQAILLRIYVRAKVTEDSLTVRYVDNANNEEFYHYSIAVTSNTTFDPGFALSGNQNQLINNTVTNIKGITQTVTAELGNLTEIAAQYRHSKYECTAAELSSDKKTVTLYYSFTNTVNFVVDFGLPITITPADVSETLTQSGVTLDGITVQGVSDGTVTIHDGNKAFTYTPNANFLKHDGEKLTVTYTGSLLTEDGQQNSAVSYQVYIFPASNVLYEENFLTPDTGSEWTRGTTSSAPTDPQQTQRVDDQNGKDIHVFGFDNVYDNKLGETGVWKAENLSTDTVTGSLRTSFYGNGFDLIGNCGPDTGRILLAVAPVATPKKGVYIVSVDTRYARGNLRQVPLAHVELPNDGAYNVEIAAIGLAATSASSAGRSNVATASLTDVYSTAEDEALLSLVEKYGMTLADVKYVTMDNVIPASDAADVSLYGMPSAAALTAEPQANVEHQQGKHVEIDSFRVYRSTDKSDDIAGKYPTAEQDIVYRNILDVVEGQIVAFTEGDPAKKIAITNYEAAGGPQNEIYIGKTQSIIFHVEGATEIQVSLRAVQGATSWADATTGENPAAISTNTEMYYTVKAGDGGVFTITNHGSGLLAIGNVKLPSGAKTMSASEIDEDALRASLCAALGLSAEQPQAFQPKTFTARATTLPMLRNKRVSVLITISNDVSYVTVNGVKYTPSRYYASWQKTRLIQFGETLGKYESKTYTIIAYDANGVASAPITVNG